MISMPGGNGEQIIRENIDLLLSRLSDMDLGFDYQAEELFREYCRENSPDTYTAYEIISEEAGRFGVDGNVRKARWLASLARVIYSTLEKDSAELSVFDDFDFKSEEDPRTEGRVSYLKSKYTNLAFDRFDKIITDAKSLYADSFGASCEDVFNGVCEYCILPIGNSQDGMLPAFKSMIAKYGLHISATVSIEDGEGGSTTMALLSRSMKAPNEEIFGEYRFEFSVDSPDNDDITCILESARRHGFKIFGIASMLYGDTHPEITFTFSADDATFRSLRTFVFTLSAIFPSFKPKGLYIHLS